MTSSKSPWGWALLAALCSSAAGPVHGAQTVFETTPSYINPWGTAWDGEALWVISKDRTLRRHEPEHGQLIQELRTDVPTARFGVAWDGECLWVASLSNELFRVDPGSGRVVGSVAMNSPTGQIEGIPVSLAWANDALWVLMINPSSIYRVDPRTGAMSDRIVLAYGQFFGLTWDGRHFWVSNVDTDLIYEVDPEFGGTVRTFPAPGAYPTGLAWDGHYLWNADPFGRGGPFPNQRIYKVDVQAQPVEPLRVQDWFQTPRYSGKDIELDHGLLWHTESWDDSVYLIQPDVPPRILRRFSVPYLGPTGIADDGASLWIADGQSRRLFRHDRDTGEITGVRSCPASIPLGLAFDGTDLWIADIGENELFVVSRDHGFVVRTLHPPGPGAAGVAWSDSTLWMCDWLSDRLYQLDPWTGEVLKAYEVPVGTPFGIAVDRGAGDVWIVDAGADRIVRCLLPSTPYDLLISAPRRWATPLSCRGARRGLRCLPPSRSSAAGPRSRPFARSVRPCRASTTSPIEIRYPEPSLTIACRTPPARSGPSRSPFASPIRGPGLPGPSTRSTSIRPSRIPSGPRSPFVIAALRPPACASS